LTTGLHNKFFWGKIYEIPPRRDGAALKNTKLEAGRVKKSGIRYRVQGKTALRLGGKKAG
jgi:hypothetical protein